MKNQQFIDVALLRSYRTANDETKKILHEIYGYSTFNLYNQNDEVILLGCILKEMRDNNQQETVYKYHDKDDELRLICRLEVIKKNPDAPIPTSSIPEDKSGNLDKLFKRFKEVKKKLSHWT